ncbi:uncharacterized protein LOC119670601 [Teleopsis dalmanni]|uniref:uncharacterized protein LOC119670601 n=1 Tax=Teleopsis dalmanni TaxID=139649 RepID=UPI0018CF2DB2|nr:uncharacterized protein LOC119670601 [Teleopsis dalmanni]
MRNIVGNLWLVTCYRKIVPPCVTALRNARLGFTANKILKMIKQNDNRNIRVLQFLEAYEKQESLWNPALKSYKDKAARDEAYMRIIKELNVPTLTVHDVRLKVKSIRTTYTKELRLLTKHKKEGTLYNPKLFWFHRANCFLKNVSLPRGKSQFRQVKSNECKAKPDEVDIQRDTLLDISENISNLDDEARENDIESYSCKKLDNSQLEAHMNEIDASIGNIEVSCAKYQSFNQQSEDEFKQHSAETMVINTKVTRTNSNEPSSNSSVIDASHSNSINNISILDEYEIFCQSVAVQLRSISDNYSRSVAKLKIQQILFEAETGHYRHNPCITIPVGQDINNVPGENLL